MADSEELTNKLQEMGVSSVPDLLAKLKEAKSSPGGIQGYAQGAGFSFSDLPTILKMIDAWLGIDENQDVAKPYIEDIRDLIGSVTGAAEPIAISYIRSTYPNFGRLLSGETGTGVGEGKAENTDTDEVQDRAIPPKEALYWEAYELHKQSYSASEISDELYNRYGVDIFPMHIARAMKRIEATEAAKLKEKANTSTQMNPATATKTPTPVNPGAIPQDRDAHIVFSTLANVIIFWGKIKFWVYISIAAVTGAVVEKIIVMR